MDTPILDENGEKIVDEKSASTCTLVEKPIIETEISPKISPPKPPPLPGSLGAPQKSLYRGIDRPYGIIFECKVFHNFPSPLKNGVGSRWITNSHDVTEEINQNSDSSSTSSNDTSSNASREHKKILESVLSKTALAPPGRKPFTYTPHLEELKAASKRWKRFNDADYAATSKEKFQPELPSLPVPCYTGTAAPKKSHQSPSLRNLERWTESESSLEPQQQSNYYHNNSAPMQQNQVGGGRNLYYDAQRPEPYNDLSPSPAQSPAPFYKMATADPAPGYNMAAGTWAPPKIPYTVGRHTLPNGHSHADMTRKKENTPPIPINITVIKKPNPNQAGQPYLPAATRNQSSSYYVPSDRAVPVRIINETTIPTNGNTIPRGGRGYYTDVYKPVKGARSCSNLLNDSPNGNYNNNLWKSCKAPAEVDPNFRHSVYRQMEETPWGKDFHIAKHVVTPSRSTDNLDADVERYFGHVPNIIPQNIWVTKEYFASGREGQLSGDYPTSSNMSARDWVELRGTTDF